MKKQLTIGWPRISLTILFIIGWALGIPSPAGAEPLEPGRDIDVLRDLGARFRVELGQERTPVYFELLQNDQPANRLLNLNPNVTLVSMDSHNHPIYFKGTNVDAARTISTDAVWPGGGSGFSMTGSGTLLGELQMWDGGDVRATHQEFGGRISNADAIGYDHYHATRVAGTIVASGNYQSNSKGMSFAAPLKTHDWNDDVPEMAYALADDRMKISNHSYGVITGWYHGYWNEQSGGNNQSGYFWAGDSTVSYIEDYRFGFYSDQAADWDQLVDLAQDYVIVKAAGNDRGDIAPPTGDPYWVWSPSQQQWVERNDGDLHNDDAESNNGYDTLPPISTAKNIISVGAVEDITAGYSQPSDVILTSYSSFGPTDDGRIKPDLVANGVNLYTTLNSSDTAYGSLNGTSAAAPTVCGSANLLQQYFAEYQSRFPLAATIKALLIQTADESGTSDGPDYRHGWGLMNTKAAAELLQSDELTPGYIIEQALADGQTDSWRFCHDGTEALKLTIAWSDPAGTSPTAALDPTTSMLVNDLDLRLEHLETGTLYNPYVLNPVNPTSAASTGDNHIDNVEQIMVENPPAGTYRVTVTHKGTLAASQRYAVVASHKLDGWYDITGSTLEGGPNDASAGVAWGDYDGDLYEDLYVVNSGDPNVLYHNNGDGTFSDVTPTLLADTNNARCAQWVDYDKDGDLDLYLVSWSNNRLFRNDGGTFTTDVAAALGVDHAGIDESSAWGDYDNDGDPDLYLASNGDNALLRNDGTSFTNVTSTSGAGSSNSSRSATWADYDNDGDLDLYLTNSGNNQLFDNNGDGTFSTAASVPLGSTGELSMGAAWGDYDNDGDLDLYVTNYFNEPNYLFRNDAGTFADVTSDPLGDTLDGTSVAWLDFDNDGDLDLYVSNADWNGDFSPNRLFENRGGDVFTDATSTLTGNINQSYAAGIADIDRDGQLDIFQANWNNENLLIRNEQCLSGNWLRVALLGTLSDTHGIGARVRIEIGGDIQIREISCGSGYCSQHSPVAAFGLGENSVVDLIQVFWPSGMVTELENVRAGHTILMREYSSDSKVQMVANGNFDTGDLNGWSFNSGTNPGHPEPQNAVQDIDQYSNALRIWRDPDTDGSHAVVLQEIDQTINNNFPITLSFAVRVDDHNFSSYNSWNVYPANVWVDYEDSLGAAHTFRRSFYTMITNGHTPDSEPLAEQLVAGTWVQRSYDLSQIEPPMAKVVNLRVGSLGWSYDVAFDDLSIVWEPMYSGVDDSEDINHDTPSQVRLFNNYPNPFNPITHITFEVSQMQFVTLQVFDITGRLIRTLQKGELDVGRYVVQWDGRDDSGRSLASGIYFARLGALGVSQTKKMVLLK